MGKRADKFDIKSLLSKSSLQEIQQDIKPDDSQDTKAAQPTVAYISIHDLIASEGNFYSMEQIEELKIAIELVGGVKQNLIVVPLGDGKYKVIAGHRRCMATWELVVNEQKKEYECLPCSIEKSEEDAKAQAMKEDLLLILLNSQRVKTEFDKVQEVERLKAVLEKYREEESISGRTREIIAQLLNTSSSQIERRERIAKDLTPEFKQELREQKINAYTAHELARLPAEEQKNLYQEYTDKGSISAKDIQIQAKSDRQKAKVTPIKTAPEEATPKAPEPVPDTKPLNIYVCSPYGGLSENYHKAVEYCKHVALQGHIPFASHVMLHGILQDDIQDQRLKGLQAGFEMIRIVDQVWVFNPDGEVTKGMKQEIDLAKQLGKTIVYKGGGEA